MPGFAAVTANRPSVTSLCAWRSPSPRSLRAAPSTCGGGGSGLPAMRLERGRAGVPVVKRLPGVEDQAIPARQLQSRGEAIFPVVVGRDADAGKTAFLRDGLPEP